jgi:hypothetical protein
MLSAAEYIYHIEQGVFALQEVLLASMYIFYASQLLKTGSKKQTRKAVLILLCVHFLVVGLDAANTVFQYTEKIKLGAILHSLFYAIKLRFEFVVLDQLQAVVSRGSVSSLGLASGQTDLESDVRMRFGSEHTVVQDTRHEMGFPTTTDAALPLPEPSVQIAGNGGPGWRQAEWPERSIYGVDQIVRCSDSDRIGAVEISKCTRDSIDDLEALYLGRWYKDNRRIM